MVMVRFPASTASMVPMTVTLPDSPGDCPIGTNISVASCPWASAAPPSTSVPITAAFIKAFRMATRLPPSPTIRPRSSSRPDEQAPGRLQLANGLPGVPAFEEHAPGCSPFLRSRLFQVGDGLGMQPPAFEDSNAVLGPPDGDLQRLLHLGGARPLPHGLQELHALPDVLQDIDDPEKGRDGDDLRRVELYPRPFRIETGQELPRRRVVERLSIIEGDRALDGLDRIVVEERARGGRLHQRRDVERAVSRPAETVIPRDLLPR